MHVWFVMLAKTQIPLLDCLDIDIFDLSAIALKTKTLHPAFNFLFFLSISKWL